LKIFNSINEFNLAKECLPNLTFVPTMGNLHAGHISLIDIGKKTGNSVISTIYVNKLQFNNSDDFKNYPKTLDNDIKLLKEHGCDYLLIPDNSILENIENIKAPAKSQKLCGANRPGHFDGVLTILKRMFDIVEPEIVVFGMKDFQQFVLVKDFIKKRAKEGIKKKEFRDPNAPYVPKGNSSSAILENFLVDRIDPNNSIHVEFLTKAILGQHPSSSGINIETEWRNMVEIIYATWIEPPSNQIVYLKPLTTKARLEINSLPSNEERRLYFINLLINLYNGILKRSTPDEARSKVTMLLWALNLTIQE